MHVSNNTNGTIGTVLHENGVSDRCKRLKYAMCDYSIGKTISSSSIKAWIRLVCAFIKIYTQFEKKWLEHFGKFQNRNFFGTQCTSCNAIPIFLYNTWSQSFNSIKIGTITVMGLNNFNFKDIYIFFIIGRRRIRL